MPEKFSCNKLPGTKIIFIIHLFNYAIFSLQMLHLYFIFVDINNATVISGSM